MLFRSVDLVYSKITDLWSNAALIMQDQLSQIGIKINIVEQEWSAYLGNVLLPGKYDITIVGFNGGNEVDGILLPDVAVPLGTHTGWNLYKAPFPEGELCDRDGSFAAFAPTRAERESRGDPRPSTAQPVASLVNAG